MKKKNQRKHFERLSEFMAVNHKYSINTRFHPVERNWVNQYDTHSIIINYCVMSVMKLIDQEL